MFVGENLTNLRIMHGYSRKQLSEQLGVTEQAVWQYENAYTSPKVPIVNELKRIFSVKSKYFYTKDMLTQRNNAANIDVMNIAYRSKVMNVISKTQTEAKHVEYLDTFINYITAQISLPTLNIIQLREEAIEYMNHTDDDRTTQIHYVAHLARQRLNMEPSTNENLMFRIEKVVYMFLKKRLVKKLMRTAFGHEMIVRLSYWATSNVLRFVGILILHMNLVICCFIIVLNLSIWTEKNTN